MRKIRCLLFLALCFLTGGMVSAQEAPETPETPAKKASPRTGIGIACWSWGFELDTRYGEPIYFGKTKYKKGVFSHAPSELHIRLPKPGAKFTATVGLDTVGSRDVSQVQFFVFLNGECVFQSDSMHLDTPPIPVQVELDGATEFILSVSEMGWDSHDQAVWADAKVEYADGTSAFLSDMPYFMQSNEECIQTPGELPASVIASTSNDGTVKIWDMADGRLLRTISRDYRGLGRIGFSPDGKYLFMMGDDTRVAFIVEAETGEVVKKLTGHTDRAIRADWTPDGKTLVTVSHDRTARVWDVERGVEKTILTGYPARCWGLACSPDGKTVAVAGEDKTIWLWDIQEGKLLWVLTNSRGTGDHPGVKFSPDGRFLATAGADKIVSIWNVKTGKLEKELAGSAEKVECVAFSPDGKLVAAGSWDLNIYLWDMETGALRGMLRGHGGHVYGIQFTSDSKRLISCGNWDDSIRIWNVATKKCEKVLMGHTSHVTDVAVRE